LLHRRIKAFILGLSAIALMSPAALAAGGSTTVAVAAGALTLTGAAPANFASVALDGTDQSSNASLATFTVNDSRGTGAGWRVTALATQFKEYDTTLNQYVLSGRSIPASSLQMAQPTMTRTGGGNSANPTVASGPYTIDAASAATVSSAAVGAGMGKYQYGATTLTLSIPASTYARTYRSDVTVDAISGP
jgi:hypothetical protein